MEQCRGTISLSSSTGELGKALSLLVCLNNDPSLSSAGMESSERPTLVAFSEVLEPPGEVNGRVIEATNNDNGVQRKEEEEEEEEEEVMLLQRLRALESEKERCEAELQRERAGVVSQLGELQGLVEELGGYDMLPDSLKAMLAAVNSSSMGPPPPPPPRPSPSC